LTIANGGTVVSGLDGQRSRVSGGGGSPNDGSSAIISGAGSRWLVNGDFEIGDSGEAHLTIEGGGQVISGVNGDRTRVYGGGGRSEPATTATVRGQGSYWQIGGDFVVGGGGEAKLSVLDGGRVLSGLRGDSVVVSADGENASVTVDGVGSSWSALTDLRLQGDRPARLNVWHGGNVSVGRTLRGDQDSVIDLDEGVLNATSIITEGMIRGTGDLRGSVASGGLIDPGHSLGHLSVQGSLELNPKGRLMIELGGTPDTVSSDLLSITGVALLDGHVDVTLLDGFMPKSGHFHGP
jgi:T5SS/PEP-CTERM-associated repeat protein